MSTRDRRREIAMGRIQRLAYLAGREPDKDRARSCIRIARNISMRHRVPLTRQLRRFACRGCNAYLVPGRNCRIRLKKSRIVITCLECGRVRRYPYP